MADLPFQLVQAIEEEGGVVPFARFMELALTHPEVGYYSRSDRVLGEGGDFSTAPRLAPGFNRAVAGTLASLVDAIVDGRVVVVEVGGGEGDLAAGVLDHWQSARPDLRERVSYVVLDVAEGLRVRQADAIAPFARAGWDVRVAGPNGPGPEGGAFGGDGPVTGIVISNELIDALPVHLVDVRGADPSEAWVSVVRNPDGSARCVESWDSLSEDAAAELRFLMGGDDTERAERARAFTSDGILELRPAVRSLFDRWTDWFEESIVMTVDYGDWLPGPFAGAPHEGATGGFVVGGSTDVLALHGRTLRGYHRHRVTRDPYRSVGRQDLTADVDFRAVALHGEACGLECLLFVPLARFLAAAGEEPPAGAPEVVPGAAADVPGAAADVPAAALGDPPTVSGDVSGMGRGRAVYTLQADIEGAPLAALLDESGLGGLFKVMLQVRERPTV